MMAVLVDRLVPKIQRHEIDGADAPAKLTIEFQRSGGGRGSGQ